jgi:hypothetical protein
MPGFWFIMGAPGSALKACRHEHLGLSGGKDMRSVKAIRWADPRSWSPPLASLLPLWLFSFAIMAEGFPRPPISAEVAITSLVTAIVASIALMGKRWMTIGLLLYSLVPFLLLGILDEISTAYKTPFILLCTVILTAGAIGYWCLPFSRRWRWLVLLAVGTVALLTASHAANSFWGMASDLGYEQCFPDAHGCPPLAGRGLPWSGLVFGF